MQYAELHCKTNFSFLEGASHAEELAVRAAELGYHAWAVTDRNTLAGVVRAHIASKEAAIKLIVGAEITPLDAPPVVLWAIDRAGYGRLSRLITVGRRRAAKGECELYFDDVAEHQQGLLAGVIAGEEEPPNRCFPWKEVFGDRAYLLAELCRGVDDRKRLLRLRALSKETRIPLVAAGNVLYHAPHRIALRDVLSAVKHKTTIEQLGACRDANAERHMRELENIASLLHDAKNTNARLLRRTCEIADRCQFSLDELRYEYPEELAPPGLSPWEHLHWLTWEGAAQRYPEGVPGKVRELLEHELRLIRELRYEAYFLTVWDLVRFARSRGILCQGRGSAANSAVCYCLGVTSVDPDKTDLLFERFVSRERDEAPDIDVDFEHERREEVLQYLYEKYGRERTGLTAVVVTYRMRSALRDVGKALGLSLDRVDALAKNTDGRTHDEKLADRCREAGVDPQSEIGRRLIFLVNELVGFPRHLSQHVGGMVITQGPLCELAPIENAAMQDRTVIQWDKDDLDELGILKVDCLCLGMLTAIRKSFDLIERHQRRKLTLASVPPEDPQVYDMICEADTIGVFQIESRAQMSMLPRLKPRCFYDLVIEVAIVRPGPIQGDMVHPYLRRRSGDEKPTYPSEAIREVLKKTLGVPLFQEQAMRLAVVAAGFTPGEADQLRRAMGAWRRPGVIDKFRQRLLQGMRQRGLSEHFAELVFNQIRGFGEYGFPESHAASFALLVYVSAWLKRHHPAAFFAGILNSQPMGFYAPAQLIGNARQHGVIVRPIDVNFSGRDCTLESADDCGHSLRECAPAEAFQGAEIARSRSQRPQEPALRLGLRLISGLSKAHALAVAEARRDSPFRTVDELARRASLPRSALVKLADANAFASLNRSRRGSLWDAMNDPLKNMPLFAGMTDDEPNVDLPPMTAEEEVFADYLSTGLSLQGHPVSFYRPALDRLDIIPAASLQKLRHGRHVRVAGLVLLRQRPSTAKGVTFVTLEDETATANLVIRMAVWERFRGVARGCPAWIAEGIMERKDTVIHIVVQRLEDLSKRLGRVKVKSRDFR